MSSLRDAVVRGLGFAMGAAMGAVLAMLFIATSVFVFALGLGAGFAQVGMTSPPTESGGYIHLSGSRNIANRLLAVRVNGIILGTQPRDIPSQMLSGGVTYGYVVRRILEEAAKDEEIKGVLLHMQTPGGTIYGSRAIFDGITAVRRAGKPAVAFVEGLSASGGVMAMVGADKIFADHGSLIGSIGVLGPALIYYNRPVAIDGGLLGEGIVTEGGVELNIVAAGRGKDLGNPFRRPTTEELDVLNRGIQSEYDGFVRHVSTSRAIEEPVIRETMGAHIFDNQQAEHYRLIDGTLNREETIAQLAELAGIEEDFELVRPRIEQGGFLSQVFGARWFGDRTPDVAVTVRRDLCDAALRSPLAYYGDPIRLCQ